MSKSKSKLFLSFSVILAFFAWLAEKDEAARTGEPGIITRLGESPLFQAACWGALTALLEELASKNPTATHLTEAIKSILEEKP